MLVGHFAVGFAAKRAAPRASLAALLLAPLLLDALWPIFLAAGLESVRIVPGITRVTPLDLHDYPYTHSLAAALGWSLVAAFLYLAARRDRRAALVIGIGVFSHWILDFITHRPDLPLYPGSATYVGLGLWSSLGGTMAVELLMFLAGIGLYATATRARNRAGSLGMWAMILVLLGIYGYALFGPPPPSPKALMVGAFVAWIFVPWAYWIDRHREVIVGSGAGVAVEAGGDAAPS